MLTPSSSGFCTFLHQCLGRYARAIAWTCPFGSQAARMKKRKMHPRTFHILQLFDSSALLVWACFSHSRSRPKRPRRAMTRRPSLGTVRDGLNLGRLDDPNRSSFCCFSSRDLAWRNSKIHVMCTIYNSTVARQRNTYILFVSFRAHVILFPVWVHECIRQRDIHADPHPHKHRHICMCIWNLSCTCISTTKL